jgi:hypothetical protein
MAVSTSRPSRYRYEQRFTVLSWAFLITLGAVSAGFYESWSHSASPDADVAPVAPTISMHAWLDQSQPLINELVSARTTISAAASHRDIQATGSACQTASSAVAHLREHMPSPRADLNYPLQQAISGYTTGLPDCVSASRTVDGKRLQQAAGYISQGDTAMQTALGILADETDGQPGNLGVLIV